MSIKSINITKIALAFTAFFAAMFVGVFSLTFVSIIGTHYSYLFTVPVAFILCLLFVLNRYLFFALVVVTRASLDPVFDAVKLGSFGLGAVMNALVIMIALMMFLSKEKNFTMKIQHVNISWIIFLILSFISVSYAPNKLTSIKVALQFVSYAAMFYLGVMLVKTHEDFGKWIRAVLYSSVVPVIFGIYSMVFRDPHGFRLYVGEGMRLFSTTNHPACLAFYLALIISVCFYLIKTKPDYIGSTLQKLLPFYLLVLLALLVMTKSRTGWIACGLYFMLYAIIFERKYMIYIFSSAFLALLLPDVQDRLLDLQSGTSFGATGYERLNSFAWRLKYWTDSIAWMSPSHYFYGYGLSSFFQLSTDFGMGNAFQKQTVKLPAHSVYIQLFFELGILGVLSFIAIMASYILALFRDYSPSQKLLFFVASIITFDYMLAGASDNLLDYLSYIWYHWFILGLILSYTKLQSKSATPQMSNKF
ncbi:O-antigen ligase family protein [Methylophilus sp. DW102]|uniref:O-antigen ligase family protein n=1 Tax=Methylophilus sp. DW102 TaxID=3095607 RepID=UPI003092D655|nr:O-antigen ligase family protein [Methylophilus sp. DW102]